MSIPASRSDDLACLFAMRRADLGLIAWRDVLELAESRALNASVPFNGLDHLYIYIYHVLVVSVERYKHNFTGVSKSCRPVLNHL